MTTVHIDIEGRTLLDQIIDEAEELAENDILGNDPTDSQIIDCLRDITNVQFSDRSTAAKLGLAAFLRIYNMRMNIKSVTTA